MKQSFFLAVALLFCSSCGRKEFAADSQSKATLPPARKEAPDTGNPRSYEELLDAVERTDGKEARRRLEEINAKNGTISAVTAFAEWSRTNTLPIGKGNIEQENQTREFLNRFAEQNPAALSAMKKSNLSLTGPRRSVMEIFEHQWEGWNKRFEDGQTLNLLFGDKSKNLVFLPADELSNGPAIAHLVLNLKGLLLYRELQFIKALSQMEKTSLEAALERRITEARANPRKLPVEHKMMPAQIRDFLHDHAVFDAEQKFRRYVMKKSNMERPVEINVSDVEATIVSGGALIDFFRYGKDGGAVEQIEDHYGVIIVSKGEDSLFVDLGPSKRIRLCSALEMDLTDVVSEALKRTGFSKGGKRPKT